MPGQLNLVLPRAKGSARHAQSEELAVRRCDAEGLLWRSKAYVATTCQRTRNLVKFVSDGCTVPHSPSQL